MWVPKWIPRGSKWSLSRYILNYVIKITNGIKSNIINKHNILKYKPVSYFQFKTLMNAWIRTLSVVSILSVKIHKVHTVVFVSQDLNREVKLILIINRILVMILNCCYYFTNVNHSKEYYMNIKIDNYKIII